MQFSTLRALREHALRLAVLSLTSLLVACSPSSQGGSETSAVPPAAASAVNVPAGEYNIDASHASLLFRVSHLGFSNYTARFKRFTAQLQFDPKNLATASVVVNIDPRSLETDFPDPAKIDFNAELLSEQWLNVAQFPEMTFRSTSVKATSATTAQVTGDLTLRGVTKPVVLETTFNGGYPGLPQFDPNARIGFSARGSLKRSDFGVSYGIPAPGSNLGVSDAVEVIIEAEFTGPPLVSETAPGGDPSAAAGAATSEH